MSKPFNQVLKQAQGDTPMPVGSEEDSIPANLFTKE